MPREPKPADVSRLPGALRLYQVTSIITGVFLLLLTAEVIAKFGLGYELELGGAGGFLAFVPVGTVAAVNVSTAILIMHGWFYVLYLFADFRLWSLMRWPVATFLLIALGGIIPTLSFFLEGPIGRRVKRFLADHSAAEATDTTRAEARS